MKLTFDDDGTVRRDGEPIGWVEQYEHRTHEMAPVGNISLGVHLSRLWNAYDAQHRRLTKYIGETTRARAAERVLAAAGPPAPRPTTVDGFWDLYEDELRRSIRRAPDEYALMPNEQPEDFARRIRVKFAADRGLHAINLNSGTWKRVAARLGLEPFSHGRLIDFFHALPGAPPHPRDLPTPAQAARRARRELSRYAPVTAAAPPAPVAEKLARALADVEGELSRRPTPGAATSGYGRPGTASEAYKRLIMAGGRTDAQIHAAVAREIGEDKAGPPSYVKWYRGWLRKHDFNPPDEG